ncbi:MAG: 1,4-dihydroxy-2-naphthoate octaprenyltransferase [Opitutales bacterium]|nr:1,4-dihydroxy-2-naphthoate octaprenyltransferase [Opitutales bacterium]
MKRISPAKALLFAARPKTLPAALAPILLGSACAGACGGFDAVPAILAALFALFAQIACNLANDLGDFKKGADTAARLGPERATSLGWLSPRQMFVATLTAVMVACACGMGLVAYGGPWMLLVGALSVLACLAYTLGPWPLAYHGLGDVFVVIFFGFVAVMFTAYTQVLVFPPFAWVLALACGLGADNILLINNLRDEETDRVAKKRTTIVIFGRRFGLGLYLFNFCFMFLSPLILRYGYGLEALCVLLPMVILPWMIAGPLKTLSEFEDPRTLNPLLGKTAGILFVYALTQSVGLFLSYGQFSI